MFNLPNSNLWSGLGKSCSWACLFEQKCLWFLNLSLSLETNCILQLGQTTRDRKRFFRLLPCRLVKNLHGSFISMKCPSWRLHDSFSVECGKTASKSMIFGFSSFSYVIFVSTDFTWPPRIVYMFIESLWWLFCFTNCWIWLILMGNSIPSMSNSWLMKST